VEREVAIAGFQRAIPAICWQICQAAAHCPTSHHRDQQTRDRILGQRQKATSSGDSAPHTERIPRCMDATHTRALRECCAHIRAIRSSGNREHFSGRVSRSRRESKATPETFTLEFEHKVQLVGKSADSQCDVWALLNTAAGGLSLSVEAKANETFGQGNESLQDWLIAGGSERSRRNRKSRWEHISAHLPCLAQGAYSLVPYQLLHRCAAAVIEAKRFRLSSAAFIVQAFWAPDESLEAFGRLCQVMSVIVKRGQMQVTSVDGIRLGVGWVDCPFATDAEGAGVA
jgi:hypothetical protein